MADDKDPNAGLFGDDEPELTPEEAHEMMTFGKNPDRVRAMSDLFGEDLIKSALEDPTLPEEAKRQMIFKLTANSVLDMIMDSLSPEPAEEVAQCLDGYICVGIVNKKFGLDLYKELYEALDKVEKKEGESEEDYDKRLDEMSDQWWYIPQPLLNQRNPSDAIREEMAKYGLED